MNTNKALLSLSLALALSTACTNPNPPVKEESTTIVEEKITEIEETPPAIDKTASIAKIDQKRAEVEALTINPIEISTANLREKVKQKWHKLHFYAVDGNLLKVKAYPYSEITKRTEEFYADNNSLVLVVIEDNGEGAKGKDKTELDKMYYFQDGQLIQELKKNEAEEYTIKESDAEELLAEFNEYLELFRKAKQ